MYRLLVQPFPIRNPGQRDEAVRDVALRKLLSVLLDHLPHCLRVSRFRSRAQALVDAGCVLRDGRRSRGKHRLAHALPMTAGTVRVLEVV